MFCVEPCFSQENEEQNKIDTLAAHYERFSCENPQERVTVHFDNTSYYKGEHIYYKANVTCGDGLRATPLSRILYVDLVSPSGYPLQTQKLIIRNGQACGSFLLDSTLVAGYYEVRAYTSWMLNFCKADKHGWSMITNKWGRDRLGKWTTDFYRWNAGLFSRVFPVYESVDSGHYERRYMAPLPKVTSTIVNDVKDKLKVSFYPEGGNLVKDIPTRIAFETRTKKGRLVNVEGDLKRGGDIIGKFKTVYGGRGMFAVTPTDSTDELTQGLHLAFTFEGKEYDYKLPSAQRKGYVLNVVRRGDDYLANVSRNDATKGRWLGLIVTCRGGLQVYEKLNLCDELTTTVRIQSEGLPTGVNIFTLFGADGDIVAQREIFVNNHEINPVCVAVTDSIEADSLERMTMSLHLTDGMGKAVRRKETFSLSVTDADTREDTYSSESNTMTDLLLSSEIKGFIPFANYYFERDDEEHRAALDLLMMVQGWTRYDFKEMTGQTENPWYFKIERGLSLEGYVYKPWTKSGFPQYPLLEYKPKKDIYVYAEMIGNANDSVGVGEVMAKKGYGKFSMDIPLVYGKRKMMIALNTKPQEKLPEEKRGMRTHTVTETEFRNEYPLEKEYAIHLDGAFPPLAKPYSPYETELLTETSYADNRQDLGYDPALNAFVLPEFTKVARKRWGKFDLSKPLLTIPIDEYMTYASRITGMVEDFHNFFFLGDLDEYELPTRYARFVFEYILGLSGDGATTINGHSLRNGVANRIVRDPMKMRKPAHFIYAFGRKENLAKGMEFLPPTYSFKNMKIFADLRNRDAIYQEFTNVGVAYKLDYETDTTAVVGFPMPVFMGKTFVFQGISQPDEFYSPDYSTMTLPEGQRDYRRTLYWNPNVTTNENGEATVEFYNNSTCRRLHISVGGLTHDGRPMEYYK